MWEGWVTVWSVSVKEVKGADTRDGGVNRWVRR